MDRRGLGSFFPLLAAALLVAEPLEAVERSLRVRLAQATPLTTSSYWDARQERLLGDDGGLEEFAAGADLSLPLGRRAGLVLSLDYLSSEVDRSHRRNWLEERGMEFVRGFPTPLPRNSTRLEAAPLTAAVLIELGPQLDPPRFPVQPYLGAGAGVHLWRLREVGQFTDTSVDPAGLRADEFRDSGVAPGFTLLGGVRVPIRWSILSVFAEARWDFAHDRLSGHPEGRNRLDLSTRRVTVGLAWEL